MCGRFVAASPPDELANYFGTPPVEEELAESFNVAPTAKIYAVRAPAQSRELTVMRWGLVPFWSKDLKIGARMINARSETVDSKPAFRSAFKKRRCLIPVDGFYEWAMLDDPDQKGSKKKQPYFIHRADDERSVFAGLWERWHPRDEDGARIEDAEPLDTCTILTCEPNQTMAKIHNRMPVLLAPGSWDQWLDPKSDPTAMLPLLKAAPDSLLEFRPVSTLVNSSRNHGPQLMERLSDEAAPDEAVPGQIGLDL
jgi:putative SOS response-associated peptidase YedK